MENEAQMTNEGSKRSSWECQAQLYSFELKIILILKKIPLDQKYNSIIFSRSVLALEGK